MPDVALPGCRPEPLAAYLKALGIFRLVASQVDPGARAWWHADELHLSSRLDLDGIAAFLVHDYRPTPLVSPWNKGSGFGAEDARTSPANAAAVELLRRSADKRLATYRSTIATLDALVGEEQWFSLDKVQQVTRCRNVLPDEALDWIDASVVLSNDKLTFPPLLGTGGNDGRFDFAANFMDRIGQVLGLVERPRRATPPDVLARAALTGDTAALDQETIGQFDPWGAGGPGSASLGAAKSLANPWDFILLLEGAVTFASGAARRMSGQPATSMPFMVRSSPAGHTSAAESERQRGELWAPLWSAPATYPEIARLIAQGRAEFGGRQATTGLDIARALSTLGVDRGLSTFVRHGFLERNGLATFAVPVGRMRVTQRQGAALTQQLDSWIASVRRVKNPPASLAALLRTIDDAQFAVAAGAGPAGLRRLLTTVARIDALAARSTGIRSSVRHTVSGLPAREWITAMDDDSAEHEIAVALASLRIHRGENARRAHAAGDQNEGPFRGPTPLTLLREMLCDAEWTGRTHAVAGLGQRALCDVLTDALVRIAIDHPNDSDADAGERWLPGAKAVPARLDSVLRFVAGELDDHQIGSMLAGYLLLDWRHSPRASAGTESKGPRRLPPPVFALIKPFYSFGPLPAPWQKTRLAPSRSWPRQLAVGAVDEVARDAVHRLRIGGLSPRLADRPRIPADTDVRRLAAACLIPIADNAVAELLSRTASIPDRNATTHHTEEH